MFPSIKAAKKTAVTAIKHRLVSSVAAACSLVFAFMLQILLAQVVASFAGNYFASFVYIAFEVFLTLPLLLGVAGFFRAVAWEEPVGVQAAFAPFSCGDKYLRAVKMSARIYVLIFLTRIVCMLPYGIVTALAAQNFYEGIGAAMPIWSTSLSVASTLLYVLGIMATIFYVSRYYPVLFIYSANENLSPKQVMEISRKMASGHILDFLLLALSMTHWIVLSVIVMPLIFTLPYFFMVYVVHCRFLVASYNKSVSASTNGANVFVPYF